MNCKDLIVEDELSAANLEMNLLTVSQLLSLRLVSNSIITSNIATDLDKRTLNVNSFLIVKGEVTYNSSNSDEAQTSFIQLKSVEINNVKQWRSIVEYDLQEINSKINNQLIKVMTGNEDTKQVEVEHQFTLKEYSNYSIAMIELSFSFISSLWNSSNAYIKLNDEVIWMDHHSWEDDGDCDDHYWSSPIRVILNKKQLSDNLRLSFGVKPNINMQKGKCTELLKKLKGPVVKFEDLNLSIK